MAALPLVVSRQVNLLAMYRALRLRTPAAGLQVKFERILSLNDLTFFDITMIQTSAATLMSLTCLPRHAARPFHAPAQLPHLEWTVHTLLLYPRHQEVNRSRHPMLSANSGPRKILPACFTISTRILSSLGCFSRETVLGVATVD